MGGEAGLGETEWPSQNSEAGPEGNGLGGLVAAREGLVSVWVGEMGGGGWRGQGRGRQQWPAGAGSHGSWNGEGQQGPGWSANDWQLRKAG